MTPTAVPTPVMMVAAVLMTAATAERIGVPFEEFLAHAASQVPVQRVGQPEDIAATIAFLVSQEAGFVSGQVIYVAGGPLD